MTYTNSRAQRCLSESRMDYEKTAREIVRNLCGGWLPEEHVAYVADALRSASTPPEGWKLVPVEPTAEQVFAALKVTHDKLTLQQMYIGRAAVDLMPPSGQADLTNAIVIAAEVARDYEAMLSASPSPPEKE